jgi:hypothetical protein
VDAFAVVELCQHQAVGVGVRFDCCDVGNYYMLSVPLKTGYLSLLVLLKWLW